MGQKRVFLTGGTGFLGRRLKARLEFVGACVSAPTRAELDLRDGLACQRELIRLDPDVVIHLAAVVGGIGANQREPGRFFYQNALIGMNMIEASRQAGVRKFVQVGTVCSYPKYTETPFREDDLWKGYPEETNAPYGIAKKSLLTMLHAYRAQYGLNGIYLIPVNLYGPGDNIHPESSHVVPALARKFLEAVHAGEKIVRVWGTGQASREFLHVDDAVRGIMMAAEKYDSPEPINLGSGTEISIRKLSEMIAGKAGFSGDIRFDLEKPDGQPRRRLDVSRAKEFFGWEAEIPLEKGLEDVLLDVKRRLWP